MPPCCCIFASRCYVSAEIFGASVIMPMNELLNFLKGCQLALIRLRYLL